MESLCDELKSHLSYGLKREVDGQNSAYYYIGDEILEVLHSQLYGQLSQIIMADLWGE